MEVSSFYWSCFESYLMLSLLLLYLNSHFPKNYLKLCGRQSEQVKNRQFSLHLKYTYKGVNYETDNLVYLKVNQ